MVPWWRLLPIYVLVESDMPLYRKYLSRYYISNPPESIDVQQIVTPSAWTNENGRLIPLAHLCHEMETKLMAQCGQRHNQQLTDIDSQ